MPQDVQRNNNLSISNVEQWKPPTSPVDDWKPPTEPINKAAEPITFSKAYEFANRPIVSILSPEARQQGLEASLPTLEDTPLSARLKGFMGGATEGAADYLSAAASPLSLALEGLTGGAIGARGAGLDKVATALETPGKIAAGGMVLHGGHQLLTAPDFASKAAGFTEAALGGAGLSHLARPKLKVTIPPEMALSESTGPKLLGPAPDGTPTFIGGNKGVAENRLYTRDTNAPYSIQHPEGGTVTPGDLGERVKISPSIAATYGLKPDYVTPGQEAEYNKTKKQSEHQDLEERIFKMAQEKFNMGKPLNELEQKILNRAKSDLPQFSRSNNRIEPDEHRRGSKDEYEVYNTNTDKVHSYWPTEDLAKRAAAKLGRERPEMDYRKSPERKPGKTLSFNNDISQARTSSGGVKIGANVRSLGKVLGSSLYKGDIGKITTKELLQNSLDAVRHLGENGEIHVELHETSEDPYVEVKDNGKGLTLKEIHSVFSDLGSSGKRSDENAIGGFGLAKAAPLLGGKKVEVTSIVSEKDGIYEHKFEGTPDELLDGVNIESHRIPAGQSVKTGVTVRTYIPDDSSLYHASDYVKAIAANSNFKGKIILDKNWGYSTEANKKTYQGLDLKDANVTKLQTPAANVDIIIPKDTKYGPSSGVPYQVTNNGMWQTSGRFGWEELQGIPEKVIINIRSKVPEGDADYPFTANREELRGSVEEAVKKFIKENIVTPAQGKRVDELKRAYSSMEHVPLGTDKGPFHREFFAYDVGKRLTPEELHSIIKNPVIHDLAVDLSSVIHEAMIATDNAKWNEKLEKIGFIFDQSSRGIHIPNPGENKSAILLNPFQIMSNNPPDKAASGLLHVILHEMAHIAGGGHDEDFAVRLADLYETYGAQRALDAQNKFLRTIQDAQSPGDYKEQISEVLHTYSTSRRREATYDDPLYGTGIGSKDSKSKSENRVSGNSRPSSKRTSPEQVTSVVDKLTKAIAEAMPKRAEQENMYSMERAKRIARAEKIVNPGPDGELKNPGLEGFYKQKSVLKGELPKVDYEGLKLNQSDVDTLIDSITLSEKLLPFEKIRAKVGLLKLIGGEQGVPQNNELNLLRQVYGASFDKIIEMHGGLGGSVAKKVLLEVANAPKAIMASIDLSAPMRQGLPLIHKKEFWSAIGPMIDSFKSTKNFEALQQSLHERPYFLLGKEAGLKLTEVGNDPTHREEAYGSNIANLIPGVKRSEQAYVGFLNKLRADTFDSLIDSAKAEGLHPKNVMHEIANFVNNATGRGSLGRFDKIATELNTVFFSPRLIASRLTILNPNYYIKATPFVRKEALKSLLAIAGAGLTINSLLKLFGATTNTTLSDDKGTSPLPGVGHGLPDMPTNADFMKSRFGHTRVDPYGGFQQYIVAAGRLLSGETSSSVTGKVGKLGQGFNSQTRLGVVGNFFENKLSPAASLVDVILKGKDFEGNPTNIPAEIANRFKPMFLNDLYEIYKDDPKLLPLGIASAIGMGVQTYAPPPKKGMTLRVH